MIHPDLFVGIVAIAVAIFTLGSAIFNWEWSYQLRKTRWIETRYSRETARLTLGVVGIICLVIGVYLSLGLASPHGLLKQLWGNSLGRRSPTMQPVLACNVDRA